MTVSPPRIFIVDDSIVILKLYHAYLASDPIHTYGLETFLSGPAALAQCRCQPPDLVLLDYTMPDLNGMDFLETLRTFASPIQVPVIIITDHDSTDLAVQLMKAGAQDYLLKLKVTPEAVRRSVNTILEHRQLQIQLQRQTELQGLLGSITFQIRQCLTLDEILETLVTLLRSCLGVDRVVVCRSLGSSTAIAASVRSIALSTNPEYDGCPLSVDSNACPLFKQLCRHQLSSTLIGTLHPSHPQLLDILSLENCCGIQSFITIPITIQTHASFSPRPKPLDAPSQLQEYIWGWLVVEQCSHDRQWQPWEVKFLEQLSVQVAIAIQQAELYHHLQNWNAQLEVSVADRAAALQEVEQELRHLNRDLEIRVAERTQALQAMNQRFEQLVSHINEVFWMVNLNPFEVTYLSPSYEKIWGYPAQCLYDQPHLWLETVHPEDLPLVSHLWHQAVRETGLTMDYRILRPDGQQRWIHLEGVAVQDDQGGNQRWVGMAADITDRKTSELETIRHRTLREAIFNEATDALLLIDPQDLQIMDCNQRAIELFDAVTKDELLNCNLNQLHKEPFGSRELASLSQQLQNQGFWHGELEYKTLCNIDFWGNGAAKIVKSAGQPICLFRITDITSHKEAESRIYRALQEAEEVSELKSRFIGMTSHEFRTPLAVIASSAGILQSFSHRLSEAQKQEHLTTIQTYVQHTTRLLDDILLLNRAELGQMIFNPQPLDVVEFCRQLCRELPQSDDLGQRVQVEVMHPDRFQSSPCPYLDEKLLRQTLINLLSNALKYSPPQALVTLYLDIQEDTLMFQVEDQGMGMSPADISQLFEAFHRGHNVGTIQGTGLGLSIVKKCLDLQHGQITVASEEGKGSCFTVHLPLTLDEAILNQL